MSVIKKNIIHERMSSPTPDFWKRVRFYAQIGLLVAGTATSIAIPLAAPAWVTVVLGALDTMCTTAIALSSTTTKGSDNEKLKPNKFENLINKIVKRFLKI